MAPYTDTVTRAQALTLKAVGWTNAQIEETTGIPARTLNNIFDKAVKAGFEPSVDGRLGRLSTAHVANAPKASRPRKQEAFEDEVLQQVRRDRCGRKKSCAQITIELGGRISEKTIWRILRKAGMKKTKPTKKPGLTEGMRKDRLAWCLAHESWTLEDWKKVIWSDETSIILGQRRGGYRVWRTPEEKHLRSCIRERWKGYSEFMFWGCFSYDHKGPYHIWRPETSQERKLADADLKEMNKELEPFCHAEWEITKPMSRLRLDRRNPGRVPEWKWTKANGKLTRGKGKGIDWYRYQKQVLLPKLIPFAKRCGADFQVQEDNAPAHAHRANVTLMNMMDVIRLFWCPNSPDLNMIEPTWFYLKRQTTKYGAPQSRKAAEQAWKKAWRELPQSKIRQWVERIMHHIKEVIRCEGGNEYKEGRPSWMKSRVVTRMVEVLEDEDFGSESTASDLWEDSGLDSDDEEKELVREPVFVDEVEVRAPLQEPEPEPELPQPLLQVAISVERPLRRSGRKKK